MVVRLRRGGVRGRAVGFVGRVGGFEDGSVGEEREEEGMGV